ncbi:probable WRKY transcription factor 70 [Asparagus officinalis]|uniref:probable WRKY transcription factor 70 n=1 Tax=Asparagus officinalis TaxID=4686 RepID=UPI00098E2930|nr:probable WRKY transcription factor 70 [Asparagus officinalis]
MEPSNRTGVVIEKINHTKEIVVQLRALQLPLGVTDSSSELARDLFDEAIRSLTSASLELRTATLPVEFKASDEDDGRMNLSKRKRRRRPSEDDRRRNSNLTLVTSIPHADGHLWRKYGQKKINGEKFQRNYYKCAHFKGQGCPAKKTVQQKAYNENDDAPKFRVSYIMQHTCKNFETNSKPITSDMGCEFMINQEDESNASSSPNKSQNNDEALSAITAEFTELLHSSPKEQEATTSATGNWEEMFGFGGGDGMAWDYEAMINEFFWSFVEE